MNRTRLGQLEKRKGRPLKALVELAGAAPGLSVDLRPRLLGAAGLALGRMGLLAAGAETLRRTLDLATAAGNHRAGRRTLRHLDALDGLRPPYRVPEPSPTQLETARAVSKRMRQALELPVVPAITRSELEELDELRYEHPEAALCRLLPAADRLPPALAVLWSAVTGSAYRLRAGHREEIEADLRRACGYLKAALWAARKTSDIGGEADSLQRLGYVLADRGEHRQALELAERAGGIYDRIGDRASRGKALVDQGIFLNGLGRTMEAIRAQSLALDMLPETLPMSRLAALQGLGHLHRAAGDLEAAIAYYDRASNIPGIGALFEGKLLWLRGSILCDQKRYRQAAAALRAGVELLGSTHYGEAALATTDLVRVLLLAGRPAEAAEAAASMRALVIPLHGNRFVSSAVADLLRGGHVAVTLTRVDRVREEICRAKHRRGWRSLKVLSGNQP